MICAYEMKKVYDEVHAEKEMEREIERIKKQNELIKKGIEFCENEVSKDIRKAVMEEKTSVNYYFSGTNPDGTIYRLEYTNKYNNYHPSGLVFRISFNKYNINQIMAYLKNNGFKVSLEPYYYYSNSTSNKSQGTKLTVSIPSNPCGECGR